MRILLSLCLLAFSLSANAKSRVEPVSWKVGTVEFDGHLVWDDASAAARPGLLMVPNWYGANDRAIAKARALAGKDFVILLVDMYGRGVRPANATDAGKAAGAVYADPAQLRARITKALSMLHAAGGMAPLDGTRIGAIGFCFGGAMVLELARSGADIRGVASFHGNLASKLPATPGQVKASILVMNGADDSYVPAEQIAGFQKEMHEAGADWQFVNFGGAVHCFAEPDEDGVLNAGCKYHAPSYRRSVAMMNDFFAERFAGK